MTYDTLFSLLRFAAHMLLIFLSILCFMKALFSKHPLPWQDYVRGVGGALFWAGYWLHHNPPTLQPDPLFGVSLMWVGATTMLVPAVVRMVREIKVGDPV